MMRTSRDLLEGIGVGHFNATMIIPYLMVSPATTDPKSVQIIVMVRQLQKTLWDMGATDVISSGHLDGPTAAALVQLAGPNWMRMSWGDNLTAVMNAKTVGMKLSPSGGTDGLAVPDDGQPVATGDVLGLLPDIPGGILTYGVGAYLLYRYFCKRRGR